jgi:transposase
MFKNYTINQTTLPLNMEQYIPETDVAFAVNALVEAMPQTLFLELEEQLGRPAYHPKMLLKIILYAYTQRVFSGRKIVDFIVLSSKSVCQFRNSTYSLHVFSSNIKYLIFFACITC